MKRLLIVVAVSLLASSARADFNNVALDCGDSATYYPASWWAPKRQATTSTTVSGIVYQLQKDGAPNIDTDAEFSAIQAAFTAWSGVTCSSGTSKLLFTRGANYDTRDDGDTVDSSGNYDLTAMHNVIWFEIDSWTEDSSILAYTNNLASTETGRTYTADIQYNAVDYQWRATDPSTGVTHGCTKPTEGATSTCYDARNTATHEIGHFLGLYHVTCTDAVMYPTASPTAELYTLSIHETTGVCAVYPPLTTPIGTGTGGLQRGEACDYSGASCESGLTCAVPTGFTASASWGVCTSTCTSDDDCPTAFGCNTDSGYCVPAPHDTGEGVSTADGCEACVTQADCVSGLCVKDSDTATSGYCSRTCGTDFPCDSGFSCLSLDDGTGVCYPDDAETCATDDGLQLNDLCYNSDPNNDGDTSDAEEGSCGASLICIGFQASSCNPEIGGCVYYCNIYTQPYYGERCPDPNQECCYGLADDGISCRKTADDSHTEGGCFTERRVGETCITTENSFCESGSKCIYADANTGSALCYRTCDSGSCNAYETCFSTTDTCGDDITFCCDTDQYNEDGSCIPHGVNFLRQIGVECDDNSQCASGTCYHVDGQSACSRRCNSITGAGCPGNIDVNGDAVVDGGFKCQLETNGDGWCWPRSGTPAEYLDGGSSTEDDGGCTQAPLGILSALSTGLFLLRRRRRT